MRRPGRDRIATPTSRCALTQVATWRYLRTMKAVAVKELKNRLSAYLREVKGGEVVLVTDRGQVVAELRQPTSEAPLSSIDQAIERLRAAGVLVAGLPQDPRVYRRSPLGRSVSTTDLLEAERGDR